MDPVRISCLGDLLPSNTAYNIGYGIGNRISEIIKYFSNSESNSFSSKDIVFCNLEAPIYKSPDNIYLPFAGNPEVLNLLKLLNINVVSIANNHILDHGPDVLHQTINTLRGNGFLPIGLLKNGISNIAVLEKKEKKIAFSAFNSIYDHPENTFIAPMERKILFDTLDQISRHSPDHIIFSFHWGNEYVSYPSPDQVELAHELIDNGVDIIIGHHPHVIQPIEKYNGGIIMYSLGNFLFDMLWAESVRTGMYVDLTLNEDLSVNYKIKPFRINSDFTQDYTKQAGTLSLLLKSSAKLDALKAGTRETYHKKYLKECKKCRFNARMRMKFHLLKNIFSLSSHSRSLLIRILKLKFLSLWGKN